MQNCAYRICNYFKDKYDRRKHKSKTQIERNRRNKKCCIEEIKENKLISKKHKKGF